MQAPQLMHLELSILRVFSAASHHTAPVGHTGGTLHGESFEHILKLIKTAMMFSCVFFKV